MKKLLLLFAFMLSIVSTFAVQIVDQTKNASSEPSGLAVTIFTIFIIFIFVFMFLLLFVFIIVKIATKITEYKRSKNDFLYDMFKLDSNQSHISRDSKMKYRNWKLLWIFWKRSKVYIKGEDNEYKFLGSYNGECLKKENYYCLSIYNKLGSFKTYDYVILIPMKIKNKLVQKIEMNGETVIVLECEGADQVGNTDYYFQPLIKDPKRADKFIDFADDIHANYFEKTVYRDVIKENLQSYRKNVIDAVESNPDIHFGRRKKSE